MQNAKKFRDVDEVLGSGLQVTLGDKEFTIMPLDLGDYADVKRLLRMESVRTYDLYLADMPPEERPRPSEQRLERACLLSRVVPDNEVNVFWTTNDGMRDWVYRSLRKSHPELTKDDVVKLVSGPGVLNELVTTLARLSGFTEPTGDENEQEADRGVAQVATEHTPADEGLRDDAGGGA